MISPSMTLAVAEGISNGTNKTHLCLVRSMAFKMISHESGMVFKKAKNKASTVTDRVRGGPVNTNNAAG